MVGPFSFKQNEADKINFILKKMVTLDRAGIKIFQRLFSERKFIGNYGMEW
jgi:hypothetical protein